MTDCAYCKMLDSPTTLFIYEDDSVAAFLSPTPSCAGHIVVVPKEHHVIIEQVPDFMVAHMFHVANKISVAAFDTLNALGTNILIQNGTAAGQNSSHVSIQILPRKDGDNLDFTWKPKQLSEEEMSTIEIQLKDLCENIGGFQTKSDEPVVLAEEESEPVETSADDMRKRFFRRIP